jgi:drug/metabolite transporter (DMT)-like permease
MNIYLVIFITLIAALIVSVSQFLFKKNLQTQLRGVKEIFGTLKNKYIIIGVIGYFLSLAVYLYALSNAPLSIVYPTFASTFIFITIISSVFLKEKLSSKRILGIALVFFGIVVIAASL